MPENHNGTVRDFIDSLEPGTYLGIDILPGAKVNMVLDAADLPTVGSFDMVISTECLDHCEDWKAAFIGMVTALNPGGVLMLTTRSPGFPYHRHPEDYWRFTVDDMTLIAHRAGMKVLTAVTDPTDTPNFQGVFLKAVKPDGWNVKDVDLDDVTVAEVVK